MKLHHLGKLKISKVIFENSASEEIIFTFVYGSKGKYRLLGNFKKPLFKSDVANTKRFRQVNLAGFVKNSKIKFAFFKELMPVIFFPEINV